jgi:hypothetical protein
LPQTFFFAETLPTETARMMHENRVTRMMSGDRIVCDIAQGESGGNNLPSAREYIVVRAEKCSAIASRYLGAALANRIEAGYAPKRPLIRIPDRPILRRLLPSGFFLFLRLDPRDPLEGLLDLALRLSGGRIWRIAPIHEFPDASLHVYGVLPTRVTLGTMPLGGGALSHSAWRVGKAKGKSKGNIGISEHPNIRISGYSP